MEKLSMTTVLSTQAVRLIDYLTTDKLIMYMNLNHAIIIASSVYKQIQPTTSPLIGVVFMIIAGMGGATTNALLAAKSHPILLDDFFLFSFLLCWIFISKYKTLRKFTDSFIFQLPSFLFEGYFVGYVIHNNVKRALVTFPNSHVFAPIICGGLGGCGGGLIFPYVLMSFQRKFDNYDTNLRNPSFVMFCSFTSAAYYLFFRNFPQYSIGTVSIPHEFIVGSIMAVGFGWVAIQKFYKSIPQSQKKMKTE